MLHYVLNFQEKVRIKPHHGYFSIDYSQLQKLKIRIKNKKLTIHHLMIG